MTPGRPRARLRFVFSRSEVSEARFEDWRVAQPGAAQLAWAAFRRGAGSPIKERFVGQFFRQQVAVVLCLEVVHVGAVSMRLLPDAMAGSMNEVLAVTSLPDHGSCRLVDLPAL